MTTGLIFDIRRFSTHDGEGIRTCVFFKGCPLRCVWCQNPAGLEPYAQPVWFDTRCIHCGICAATTVNGGVKLQNGTVVIDRTAKENWNKIADECPSGAFMLDAKEYRVEDVLAQVKKDEVFYRDNGGVTITGGEPLLQGKFAEELLTALQTKGYHTAIETSLYASPDTVKAVLSHADQIFCDLKLADSEAHQRFTKRPNELIKENIRWLLESDRKDRVTVRTPLIPGMTAAEENLSAIAAYLSGIYPEVRYELLNYNPLAEAKYRNTEREYCFSEEDNPKLYTKEEMKRFGEIARQGGIKNLILEL